MEVRCTSLDEVRQHIDEIDRALVALLARRGQFVAQAASFKKTTDDVRAPARVEQVIAKVREMAEQSGASPAVVEQVYRAMIAALIAEELDSHAKLIADTYQPASRQGPVRVGCHRGEQGEQKE